MANFSLVTHVIAFETEMRSLRQGIDFLTQQIITFLSTIRFLRRAISNLQDAAFDVQENELDPKFKEKLESSDSDGNPNSLDDHSDSANDATNGAHSGDGSEWGRRGGKELINTTPFFFFFLSLFLSCLFLLL